jgi:hypothetical protein
MLRLPLVAALLLAATVPAQAPPAGPRIDLSASGGSAGTGGEGPVSVSGKVVLPPGWKLTVHTLTVRHQQEGGGRTRNVLIPVKGTDFTTTMSLKAGGYRVWAVIDVKDAEGREREISSDPQTVLVR